MHTQISKRFMEYLKDNWIQFDSALRPKVIFLMNTGMILKNDETCSAL